MTATEDRAKTLAADEKRRGLFAHRVWTEGAPPTWRAHDNPHAHSSTLRKLERDGLVRRAGFGAASTGRGSVRWVTSWRWTDTGLQLARAVAATLTEWGVVS